MALCFAFLALYHLLAKDNRWGFTFTLSMMENCIEAYNNNFTTRTYSLTTKICVNTTLDNLITTLISKIIKLTTPYLFEKKIGVKWKKCYKFRIGISGIIESIVSRLTWLNLTRLQPIVGKGAARVLGVLFSDSHQISNLYIKI